MLDKIIDIITAILPFSEVAKTSANDAGRQRVQRTSEKQYGFHEAARKGAKRLFLLRFERP